MDSRHDPFVVAPSPPSAGRHRLSTFDSQFSLSPNASPTQAKRALEAHLAETDRRMEEAGKLGTALLQQRKELSQRLMEVEKQQAEGELSDDLRQRLAEIEKDYNDVARESARAFLPKQRIPSNEAATGSPFAPESKGGRRSVSPSKFEGQATASPTKFSVPNRKVRNQPANRIHDIEFAAEISTSLIAQVRNLQGLLAEKEEELKEIRAEKSKLEYEAEGFQQRVKTLDESEHRYKDENWSLETQVHDLLAKEREAEDRYKKLQQTLTVLQAEKSATQRELDEVKLNHARLGEEYAAAVKHHDIELGSAKRNQIIADAERAALRKRVDDLTSQNQELAKAISASQRARVVERESILNMNQEDSESAQDKTTPEHSPPPSPVKGTPRHALLETETLKTSLGHAHRTIQGLRSNVHREKTEKLELRRMLQEARDELEKLRNEPQPPPKRVRKTEAREQRKPLRLLGGLRTVRSEVFSEDSNWEDQPDSTSPAASTLASRGSSKFESVAEEPPEQFETANETSDAAFETAHEPATETDDFHTGAEEFSSDDDAETETESPSKRRTPRNSISVFPGRPRSGSMHSTASTEDEDFPFGHDAGAPVTLPPLQAKFPLRVSRGAYRRSRQPSEEPAFPSSPPSIASSSVAGTPHQPIQNLAAELGDFDGSDNDSYQSGTPSRRSIRGRTVSPPPPVPPLPRAIMVDSSTMTDELPRIHTHATGVDLLVPASSYDSVARDTDEETSRAPSPDPHAAELAALQAEHEKALKEISNEKATEYAAALDELKSKHEDQLNKMHQEVNLAHTRELELLKSSHTDEINKSVAEVKAVHGQELEALKLSHADELAKALADAQSIYAKELEALKSNHAKEIDEVIANANASHSRELEAVKASHSEEISNALSNAQSVHTRELETLKSSHAEEMSKSLADLRASHERELEELRLKYASQAAKESAENQAAHIQEIDALKTSFADEVSQRELETKRAHEAEIEALKSSHMEQMAARESDIKAAHAIEVESLKAKHADELNSMKTENDARHAAEIAALVAAHSSQIDQIKTELFDTHSKQVQTLQTEYAQELDKVRQQSDGAHSEELASLKAAHFAQLEEVKSTLVAAHEEELALIKAAHAKHVEDIQNGADAQRAAEIASLVASHERQIDSIKAESQATLVKELAALKEVHAQEINDLNSQHAATRTKELEAFKAAIDKQVESSKTEGDAAHSQQIEALNAAHAEVLEAQRRDNEKSQLQALESLKASHERNIEALMNENATARSKELEDVTSGHLKELDGLRQELESSKAKALDDLAASHSEQLEDLRQSHLNQLAALNTEHESAKAKLAEELANSHSEELAEIRTSFESSKAAEIAALSNSHAQALDSLKAEHARTESQKLQELADAHAQTLENIKTERDEAEARKLQDLTNAHLQELENLRQASDHAKSEALSALAAAHADELERLKETHGTEQSQQLQDLIERHTREMEDLRAESDSEKSKALAALASTHAAELESLKRENEAARVQQLEELKATHAQELDALRAEHQSTLSHALETLKGDHANELEQLKKQHDATQAEALEALRASHSRELVQLKSDADAALSRELEVLKADHANALESYQNDAAAEKEKLLADHAAELDALRKSLQVVPPVLGFSTISSTETEPVEAPELRSPRRDAFIIPREDRPAHTSSDTTGLGLLARRGERASTPEIAEDDTRQSTSASPAPESPESQRPFKELSANTNVRPSQKSAIQTSNQGSQTTLTSDGLDQLLKQQNHLSPESVATTTPRGEVAVTPYDESEAKQKIGDSSVVSTADPIAARRPGSSASAQASTSSRPPLPLNHREVIEAARTHSSSGGKGSMGPPTLPASAYSNSGSRPETPSSRRPLSPNSIVRGTPTPKAGRASTPGHADTHSGTRMLLRSRQSSVSSFASEIDTRFNIHGNMGMDASAFGPGTDPRMIQAITQTMIGEYLWKYTRKAGRGEMSENRHRRYFWVHPYTRTLYWSDRDPSTAGRTELRAKSIPIEAVRIVGDDNPMPPGLHRKSLIIVSPGRTVKFTCTTGQRHETWFNALSYLLLRTGNESQADAEDVAGQITQEDVDEFNPSINRRPVNGNRSRPPPSLSSYNSGATRTGSPRVEVSMSIPTLTPTRERESARSGTLGRLSGYWKSSSINSTFSSLRSKTHIPQEGAIYEASEVPDSAEDLRQIMEEQDRASDRLENVRACCDGKHDVGTLSHTKRGRIPTSHSQTHSHTHPGPSTTPTPGSTAQTQA
ncbi:hypothetical protein Daesc_001361 [Daldinia eschscholtzii]|uniref:PH domain-containing protein n=1 Tax=Daldinia eschscholtzii TaxID=292717 RepID=A0AAX6MV90_9PEZI